MPGGSHGTMKRQLTPSGEVAGTLSAAACGNSILIWSGRAWTGFWLICMYAVTSIGAPPADQTVPFGAGIAFGSCGAIWTIRLSCEVLGTIDAGQLTIVFWSEELSVPFWPGIVVSAVGFGVSVGVGTQIVKCVATFVVAMPFEIVAVTVQNCGVAELNGCV